MAIFITIEWICQPDLQGTIQNLILIIILHVVFLLCAIFWSLIIKFLLKHPSTNFLNLSSPPTIRPNGHFFLQSSLNQKKPSDIHWEMSWAIFRQIRRFKCNTCRKSTMWIFVTKMFMKLLPFATQLKIRRPRLYQTLHCPACSDDHVESVAHIQGSARIRSDQDFGDPIRI